jgi:hypothetical protein
MQNLDVEEIYIKLLKVSKTINSTSNLDKILQESVNEIAKELNLIGTAIFIREGDIIRIKTITNTLLLSKIKNVLGLDLSRYVLSLKNDHGSLLAKSINEMKTQQTHQASDFLVPAVSINIAKILQKISGHKSGIVFPMIFKNEAIGCILYGRNYKSDFSDVYDLLEIYTKNIADVIGIK